MRYVSTRGQAPSLGFGDTLLTGLARDGGLYVPERWPTLGPSLAGDYVSTAVDVMAPFVEGSIEIDDFGTMVEDAYATFDHPDVTPLVELEEGLFLLELFHGPTLAFKDVALQLVGRLFDHELNRRDDRVTIVTATSGDTGSAAIEACRGRERIDVVVLHPHGRTSDVQRRQMTTVDEPNVHNIAIEGSFDDCQDLVKAMFADEPFRAARRLAAMNSINWARVMAQIVYYVVAAERLGGRDRPVSFSVPSGNFGNVLAGHGARRMGVAVRQLVVASNTNDVLTQFFTTGSMALTAVVPTLSPSMDIQVSSNLERLLFELHDRDGEQVAALLDQFRAEGAIAIAPDVLAGLSETWSGASIDDPTTSGVIAAVASEYGQILDPHTAVGFAAANRCRVDPTTPMIVLATASPAKFPEAVESAVGRPPDVPASLAALDDRSERFDVLPNELATVQAHITAVTES